MLWTENKGQPWSTVTQHHAISHPDDCSSGNPECNLFMDPGPCAPAIAHSGALQRKPDPVQTIHCFQTLAGLMAAVYGTGDGSDCPCKQAL